ncbi:PAS domain-containing protein [Coralloluteibacterium stylophorae]|uniref:histidine kinase n=1 Tax=Coralloluteibacterium stylophorae TaxID=1776034 RepID=A0AAP2CE80_9GAMM|nr:PAS domain-containing protein [Coralloluteibacterium stylophorae]MBS7458634.1 PAS domain-containing protein [Coralloluteibacterium stylophorae]
MSTRSAWRSSDRSAAEHGPAPQVAWAAALDGLLAVAPALFGVATVAVVADDGRAPRVAAAAGAERPEIDPHRCAALLPRGAGDAVVVEAGDGMRFFAGLRVPGSADADLLLCLLDDAPRALPEAQGRALAAFAHQLGDRLRLDAERDARGGEQARIRQLEAEHRAERDHHLAVLDSAVDYAILAFEADGRIDAWNRGAEAIFGWPQADALGRDIGEFFTADDVRAGVPAALRETARDAGRAVETRWMRRRDGSGFWARGELMPRRGAGGACSGFVLVLRDRTEQIEREQELQRSRERLDMALATAGAVGVWDYDAVADRVHASEDFARRFGAPGGDAEAGLPLAVFLQGVHPDDRERVLHNIRATLLSGDQLQEEYRIGADTPQGEIWVLASSQVQRDADGRALRLPGVLIDITERKRTEARQAFLLDLSDRLQHARSGRDVALTVSESIGDVLGVARLNYGQVEDDVLLVEQGAQGRQALQQPLRLPLAELGAGFLAALAGGETVAVDDVRTHPLTRERRELYLARDAQAFVAVPLLDAGRLRALFYIKSQRPRRWSGHDLALLQDIAERTRIAEGRARAEEAAMDARERLYLATQATGLGVWDLDVRTGKLNWDRRVRELFGLGSNAPVDLDAFYRGLHPDDRDRVGREVARAIEGGPGVGFNTEYRTVDPVDGRVRVIAANGLTVHEEGEPVWFVGTVRDLTEERATAAREREIAERYRLASRATNDAVWDWDLQRDLVQWNEAVTTLFGFPQERVPPSSQWWIDSIHPDDRERVAESIHAVIEGSSEHWSEEYRFGCADGSYASVLDRGYVLRDATGEAVRMIGAMLDLTDRKRAEHALQESEDRFRAITESMPQMVWSTRPDGYHDFFNQRWYDYTGVPYGSTDAEAWLQVFHPDDHARTGARWRHSLETGEPYEIEYRLRRSDGVYRWVLGRAMATRDAAGRITRWFGTCTDIEEQVQAREALARFGEQLEREVAERTAELRRNEEALRQAQKMEAIGQLTGGIAHDFNNLLTGIVGALEIVQLRIRQGRTQDIGRFAEAAIAAANRAAALTHRLLAFSRRQPLDPRAVDANRLVRSMEELLRRTLGETVALEIDIRPALWVTLCDPHQLENALLNLVINARDAMPGGGRLQVRTANSDLRDPAEAAEAGVDPGEYVTLCVSDTGHGMSAEVIERAFDPFFTTKAFGKGTGLGLSMIYGFVRQSGGFTRILSTPEQGTAVTLYLPRHHGEAESERRAVRHVEVQAAPADEVVLVVEDEATVRELVVQVLRDLGYAAIEAADGPAGLEILRSEARIDLLVSDIGLPGINGRQLAMEARRLRPELGVLLMTGYAPDATAAEGFLEAGMELVTKPFTLEALAARIRAMVGAG